MNLWKRRERVAWICGVQDRISQDPVFVWPPVSLGGNYPCELKAWALRSETLGAEKRAAVTELSTGAGGVFLFRDTCKSLEESHHRCQQSKEHLLTSLQGQCSSETHTSKSQWEQHLPFHVSMEVSLAIFSSLGSGCSQKPWAV